MIARQQRTDEMSLPKRLGIDFKIPGTDLAIITLLACLMVSTPALPDEEAGDAALPADHGYMLIHVDVNSRERINVFSFTEVDTGHQVTTRKNVYRSVGVNAWMALVAAPSGRYFWSEYEAIAGSVVEGTRNLDALFGRSAPNSADDTFEIVPGVVNYVGDWRMHIVSANRRRIDPIISLETSTLQRYVEEYPELATKYPVYVSMMGKKAISLDELAKMMKSQSN